MEEVAPILKEAHHEILVLINKEGKFLGILSRLEANLSQASEDQIAHS
jgi:CBS-domain-containing membrane protein